MIRFLQDSIALPLNQNTHSMCTRAKAHFPCQRELPDSRLSVYVRSADLGGLEVQLGEGSGFGSKD